MRVFMCEKCEARSRVCVCLETLCMDLMHVMDSIHSVYGVSSVIQGGLKALSPPNHGSLTLAQRLHPSRAERHLMQIGRSACRGRTIYARLWHHSWR